MFFHSFCYCDRVQQKKKKQQQRSPEGKHHTISEVGVCVLNMRKHWILFGATNCVGVCKHSVWIGKLKRNKKGREKLNRKERTMPLREESQSIQIQIDKFDQCFFLLSFVRNSYERHSFTLQTIKPNQASKIRCHVPEKWLKYLSFLNKLVCVTCSEFVFGLNNFRAIHFMINELTKQSFISIFLSPYPHTYTSTVLEGTARDKPVDNLSTKQKILSAWDLEIWGLFFVLFCIAITFGCSIFQ